MAKAVDRIFLALESGQKIVIYGDYDADGVTSTAVLSEYLKN
jgi:single-stranded-DNA-specific exonuclease